MPIKLYISTDIYYKFKNKVFIQKILKPLKNKLVALKQKH